MKKFKTKSKRQTYYDNSEYQYKGQPKGDSETKIGLSIKSLRDLPKSSITLKTDPYTAMMPNSIPYALLNVANAKVGGSYSGDSNLDGGNVQQYSNSVMSKFLKVFDFMLMRVNLNYRYLPVSATVVGSGLVDQMIKSYAEAYSLLGATTYTVLALNNYVVATDLNMGSSEPETVTINGVEEQIYTDEAEVFYAISQVYQLILQNVHNSLVWHNSFRLKQGTMIRSAWNREVPSLNALFGLFNKKAWLNLIEGINLSFMGEYFDSDFASQAAMLNAVPSRKTNSMNDPVMELQTSFKMPSKFVMYVKTGSGENATYSKIFSLDDLTTTIDKYGTLTFTETIDSFNDMFAATNVVAWARQQSYMSVSDTGTTLFNKAKSLLDRITTCMNVFKRQFSDFREAMDVMTRTGTVYWKKGYRPSLTQDTDAALFDVVLINDIYRLVMSGADSMIYNEDTKRWRSFSLWNIYNGVPEYDSKQGGSFLSYSFKEFALPNGSTDPDQNITYVPVALSSVGDQGNVKLVSRDGQTVFLTTKTVVMNDDITLTRLAPLPSQSDLEIRVPCIDTDTSVIDPTDKIYISNLIKTGVQVFGLIDPSLPGMQTSIFMDPDYLAIYQYEIDDVSNMAINYARSYGAIRANNPTSTIFGFFGTMGRR